MVNLCCIVVQERNLMSKSRTDFATKTPFFLFCWPKHGPLEIRNQLLGPLLATYSIYHTYNPNTSGKRKSTFSMRYQSLTAWLRTITARCRRTRDSSMFLESLKPSLMKLQLTMALIQSFEAEKKVSASVKVTQRWLMRTCEANTEDDLKQR